MSELKVMPHSNAISLAAVNGTGVNTWQVSKKRENIAGIGVSVSGAGAWVKLSRSMSFRAQKLEK